MQGGMDFLAPVDTTIAALPLSPPNRYLPPEELDTKTRGAAVAIDMWGLGCLIWEIYNGVLSSPDQLKTIAKIPKTLLPQYVRLMRYGAGPLDNNVLDGSF